MLQCPVVPSCYNECLSLVSPPNSAFPSPHIRTTNPSHPISKCIETLYRFPYFCQKAALIIHCARGAACQPPSPLRSGVAAISSGSSWVSARDIHIPACSDLLLIVAQHIAMSSLSFITKSNSLKQNMSDSRCLADSQVPPGSYIAVVYTQTDRQTHLDQQPVT